MSVMRCEGCSDLIDTDGEVECWCDAKDFPLPSRFRGSDGAMLCEGCRETAIEQLEEIAHEVAANMTNAEIQSGLDRVKWAEGLILQLPETHDGRNSWLLNYGKGSEAQDLRTRRQIRFDEITEAAETFSGGGEP